MGAVLQALFKVAHEVAATGQDAVLGVQFLAHFPLTVVGVAPAVLFPNVPGDTTAQRPGQQEGRPGNTSSLKLMLERLALVPILLVRDGQPESP